MTPEYLLTSILVILLPGTGVLYTLAFGLSRGWSASVLAAIGCTLGIVPHIAASIAGLAALLHASALNPKLSLFFIAFLPQFVPANTPNPTSYMLGLAGVFMALTFIVFVGYGAFASATRRYVISKPSVLAWLRRGFAGAFAALGLRLALSDR